MYEKYWGLKGKPFQNTPNPRLVFYSSSHEEALVRMLYTITESKGLMLLLGEYGVGKSYTCTVFAREMKAKGYPVAYIQSPGRTPDDILVQALYELGIPDTRNSSRVERRQMLHEAAAGVAARGRELILIIDETELIPDPETFDEIRRMLNISAEDRFLVSVILAGTPELWAKVVAVPGMRQRVGVSYRILPLSRAETSEYIDHRLQACGLSRQLFDPAAVEVIHSTTRGIPREINTLCDLCLLIGSSEEVDVVKPSLVEKAIDEMAGARTMDHGER
jgi:type II secretory pathway predicted ATPase ExeA